MIKRKRIKKIIGIVLLLIVITAVLVLGILWNTYLNKHNLLKKFESPRGQEVYVLGTLHDYHFEKWANYSIANILGVIHQLQPDAVFIEARETYFDEYGVIDGPVDMAVAYSYCVDNDVPTELIDWWEVDNDYKTSSTDQQRDDMIFSNIEMKLNSFNKTSKILILCGTGHLYEQSERFLENGFKKLRLSKTANLFEGSNPFSYPQSSAEIWEQRAYFYAYTYPAIIEKNEELSMEVKQQFTGGNHDAFYEEQLQYCDIFSRQQLYK